MGFFEKLFDSNERDIARLRKEVVAVNNLEPQIQKLSDTQMRERIDAIRTEIREQSDKLGYTVIDKEQTIINPKIEALMKRHLPEVFALCREASVRTLGLRNFDVQMIASMALHEGRISEQKTGEGKTLTAVPALVLNGLTGRGSHLITVNDYLAKHGAEWMGPIYRLLGVSVGVLQHSTPIRGRQDVYSQEVVYGTNNEYGFDYLRDNMVIHARDMVQGELNFGIVDECDSILIDEARTPLIISGTSNEDTAMYSRVDAVIRRLKSKDITGEDKPKDIFEQAFQKKYDDESGKDWDFEYDRKHHHASLTPRGIDKVEKALDDVLVLDPNDDNPNDKNLFSYANTEVAHYVQQALRAHGLYENEVQYVVKDGEVIIVDEFTGRLMFGRRYSEGLHQAIEAKEGLDVAPESQTLATITIQNYFRQYHKLAGMTGTAKTEEDEFKKIYGMDVVVVPTNKPVTRKDVADVVYKSEKGKYDAIVSDVAERHKTGQPVLVGTVSIEKSERLASMMQKQGVPVKVLNAKYHEQEAYIVAQAGRPGTVTVATNMAGRGTDIILGGNPEFAAREQMRGMGLDPEEHDDQFRELVSQLRPEYDRNKEQVLAAGGLYVVGSERHESRRIDNQLRGRSGRQGDPGESRFFLSLQDDLMKMYGGERVEKLMEFLKIEEDMPIESGMLTKAIENAQKKVEGRNFDIRKHTLQYDDVMNKQRQVIYKERRRILEGGSLKESVLEFIDNAVKKVVEDNTVRHGREAQVDYDALIDAARSSFPIGELNAGDLEGKSPEEISEMLRAKVHNLYDQKEREIGRGVLRSILAMAAGAAASGGKVQVPDQVLMVAQAQGVVQESLGQWLSDTVSFAQQYEQAAASGSETEEMNRRAETFGAPQMREIERVVTLKSIDENWIDHLNMLDHLRSGVSLRGYGQQDPVVVYAQEAFAAFDQLKQDIQLDVIRKMFLVRIEAPVVERKSAYNIQGQVAAGSGGGQLTPGGTTESGQRIAVKAGPKLGRNNKCYCGSGKKYKQCHLPLDGGEAPDNWPELYEKAYGETAPVG